MKLSIARGTQFTSTHNYINTEWSDKKNWEVYGEYSHPHPHDYRVELIFEGELDTSSGMVFDLKEVDALLEKIKETFDGKHINKEVSFFKTHLPTTENLTYYIAGMAKEWGDGLPPMKTLRVYESKDLWAETHFK